MNSSTPSYHFNRRRLVSFILSAIVGKKRSFRQDSQVIIRGVSRFNILGAIPQTGRFPRGCLLTYNHYFRPGFLSWYMGFALTSSLPKEIKLVITSSFTYPDTFWGNLQDRAWRFALKRVAHTYSFIGMPAIPPRPEEQAARAVAIREIVAFARSATEPWIGFAPEGRDSPDGRLMMPYPGVGRLIAYLSCQLGLAIQPVGIYESDASLNICFGNPYFLDGSALQISKEDENQVSMQVMQAISVCLPERLWGEQIHP